MILTFARGSISSSLETGLGSVRAKIALMAEVLRGLRQDDLVKFKSQWSHFLIFLVIIKDSSSSLYSVFFICVYSVINFCMYIIFIITNYVITAAT